ncbi:aldose 1-epimerase [Winogradskyella thalassocola]|uniref:Aldose 1-epimerase n=1 Tax=Winogradskyella thalassocola TaxID=262004 RepID=A0A1G7WGT6_9FLAO|nr:aldose 1-epimerase [Winogradskyella thalassocola]SDG71074.1 aldose 1-epimerase [Winogradskyella thalassocola]
MYKLKNIKKDGLDYIKLQNPNETTEASICLSQGARLSEFIFNNMEIVSSIRPETYKDNYASSILFPFANRIKDGKYSFEGIDYHLLCNEEDKNNALHGLVYDKPFTIINKSLTSKSASVTLLYVSEGQLIGFPFKYHFEVTYTLNPMGINLSINIKNNGESSFPFTLGWHPYFTSSHLSVSTMEFTSSKKFLQDGRNIVSGSEDSKEVMPYQIKGKKLDDAFNLQNNTIKFLTPQYHLKIECLSEANYLQLYTPSNPNIIAIEPMTGVSNSFNNKIGLQILNVNDSYKLDWIISVET